MKGRTVLITGATSGIGRVAAVELGRMGARVGIVARSPVKAEAVAAEIRAAGGEPVVFLADLASLASVRALAGEVTQRLDALHVLLNNAGGWNTRRAVTPDGYETTIAVNHLSHYLLTRLLLDSLRRSAPARVVTVASGAHVMGRVRLDDLQLARGYGGQKAYAQSKLANILFTYELARRMDGSGVTATALHPGFVRTNFGRAGVSAVMRFGMSLLDGLMISPEEGARTSIYLASSAEVEGVTGAYFDKCRAVPSSPRSRDTAVQGALWTLSARLVGLDP